MRRRTFLIASAAAPAACGRLGADGDVFALADALRPRFRSLNVPADVFERFAAEEIRHRGLPKKVTDAVARRFLMSTDFFQHGGDPRRSLQYAAYYDPYVTPCYNPLRATT